MQAYCSKIKGKRIKYVVLLWIYQQMLTRLPEELGTTNVYLRSSALSLNVRPNKVIQAVNWFANTGMLYREEGITLNESPRHR